MALIRWWFILPAPPPSFLFSAQASDIFRRYFALKIVINTVFHQSKASPSLFFTSLFSLLLLFSVSYLIYFLVISISQSHSGYMIPSIALPWDGKVRNPCLLPSCKTWQVNRKKARAERSFKVDNLSTKGLWRNSTHHIYPYIHVS